MLKVKVHCPVRVTPLSSLPLQPIDDPNDPAQINLLIQSLAPLRYPTSNGGTVITDPEQFKEDYPFTWFRNTTDEPWIDINPCNPDNIIIVSHQDYFRRFLADIAMYSLDGGETWNKANITLSRIQNATILNAYNDFESASDPGVVFDRKGNAYFNTVSFNAVEDFDEAIVVDKSTNGGISWDQPNVTQIDSGNTHFLDFPKVYADPYRHNTVYMTWSDLLSDIGVGEFNELLIQISQDGGQVWSKPILVGTSEGLPITDGLSQGALAGQLRVLPDKSHTLVIPARWSVGLSNTLDNAFVYRSTDGGCVWQRFDVLRNIPYVFPIDPDTQIPIFAPPHVVSMDVNSKTGDLYYVQGSSQFNLTGKAGLIIQRSTDGGITWSSPIPVNPCSLAAQAFLPSVAVLDNGVVAVLFYDTRFFKPGDASLWTDVWISFFDPTLCIFLGEARLTPQSFDTRQFMRRVLPGIPLDGGFFPGDYVNMVTLNNVLYAAYTVSTPPFGVGPAPPPSGEFRVDERAGELLPNRQNIMFSKVEVDPHFNVNKYINKVCRKKKCHSCKHKSK